MNKPNKDLKTPLSHKREAKIFGNCTLNEDKGYTFGGICLRDISHISAFFQDFYDYIHSKHWLLLKDF